MAGLIFWVIVIAMIANSLIKQQKQAIERKSGKSRQGSADQAKKKPDNIYGQRKSLENAGSLQAKQMETVRKSQAELKQRLKQKNAEKQRQASPAGQLVNSRQPAKQEQNSILKQAITGGRERGKEAPVWDGLRQSQPYQAPAGGTLSLDQPEKSELMTEIDDLIIKGYQADLPFERDFVSEGVEMLNQFELFQISGS